jgi:hypothetical protein
MKDKKDTGAAVELLNITVGNKTYPCRVTLGAILGLKHSTGKDVSEIGTDLCLMTSFLHECVKSACRADDVKFDMTLIEFADRVELPALTAFAEGLQKKTTVK